MSYQVLARKWRPANFTQMVGQEHVLQALTNALDSDRLHHAYLFSGTRGVGKTTIARIFAKSLNCEQGVSSEPCGECASCSEIDQGRSVDLIEIDAASRTGVDDMRELLDNVQYAPTRSRFKVYLIDEVHMLSRHSFNALLKTLEEPPPHIKFLLATTDPQKMPVTVLSRCLQFNLKRMSRAQILSQLQYLTAQEEIEAQENALVQLAGAADGSMRDALSLLDQAIGYGGGAVQSSAVEAMLGSISRDYLERLLDALCEQQAPALLREARTVIEHNPDYQRVCAELISLLQQVALYQGDATLVNEDEFDAGLLQKYGDRWSAEEVQLYYQILLQGRQDLLICPDQAAGFEMLMLRLIAFSPRIGSESGEVEVKKKPEALTGPRNSEGVASSAPPANRPEPVESFVEPAPVSSTRWTDAASPQPGSEPAPAQAREDSHIFEPAETHETAHILESASAQDLSQICEKAVPGTGHDTKDNEQGRVQNDSEIPDIAARPASADGDASMDWNATAYELGLSGLAQEIVANSRLLSSADGYVRLQLAREIYELVNDVNRGEILQALERKLGVSLRLELNAADELAGDTPLQAKLLRQQQERLDAIEAIKDEAMVRKLQHAFAAELDETSVVKVESNG